MKWWTKKRLRTLLSTLALGMLALLAGIIYFLGSSQFEELAADYAVREIESRTGASVTLESLEADFWGRSFILNHLVLRGEESPSGPPLLAIERIELSFSLRSLISRRINLLRLEVDQPEIFLEIGEGGETNIPSPPPAGSGGAAVPFEIAIGDFLLSGGGLSINERRVDIDFEISDLEGLFAWDETERLLSGTLVYSGTIDGLVAASIPYTLETAFRYQSGNVALDPATLSSGETRLALAGTIDDFLGARQGMIDFDGVVDVPFLNYFLPDTRFLGTSDVSGEVAFSTSEVAVNGHVSADRIEVGEWVATDFESEFSYGFPERLVHATSLTTGFAGGSARGNVDIGPLPGSPTIDVDLTYEGIDPLFFGDLFPWGVEQVRNSVARGTLAGWFRGGFSDFDLEGELTLSENPSPGPGSLPSSVRGSTGFHARPGQVDVTGLVAMLGTTRAEADGTIGSEVLSVEGVVESGDLRDLRFLYPEANGSGSFMGRVSGSLARPEFAGDFVLADLSYGQWNLDRAEGYIAYHPERLELDDVVLNAGNSEISLRGSYDFLRSLPDVEINLVSLDPDTLSSFGLPATAGSVSGQLRLLSFEPIAFEGTLDVEGLAVRGFPVGSGSSRVRYGEDQIVLSDLRLEDETSRISGDLVYDRLQDNLDLDVALSGQMLEDLQELGVPDSLTGRLRQADLRVAGPLVSPSIEGEFGVDDLAYRGYLLGDGGSEVQYAPDHIALIGLHLDKELEGADTATRIAGDLDYDRTRDDLDLHFALSGQRLENFHELGVPELISGYVREADVQILGPLGAPNVDGRVSLENFAVGRQTFAVATVAIATDGGMVRGSMATDDRLDLDFEVDSSDDTYPFNGVVRFRDFDVGELAGLSSGSVIASGDADFEGPLTDLTALTGRGTVTRLDTSVGERTLEVNRPFGFEFDTKQVTVSRVELIGSGTTSVELDGTVALESDAPLDLNIYGPVDVALLASRYPGLSASGQLLLDLSVSGTVEDPQLGGTGTLVDVSISHEEVFLGLSNLNGDIFLDDRLAILADLTGTMGGGRVVLGGELGLGGTAGEAMNIDADLSNVRIRTLSGLRAVIDGTLGISGGMDAPLLEGYVQLLSLSFDGDFNEFLGLFDAGPATGGGVGPVDNMGLALHVEGDRNIRIQNELADLESRVDLDVGGTFASPTLTGHTEVTRGTVTLQGRRYRITRGNVDFVDPVGIDPRIDIQAEADIRAYRIILLITGQGDDVQVTMRSDPALPQLEIVSLIAGGRTREELADAGSLDVASEEQLFQGAASTILADMLQSRVGSRLGVLNSVRIDPFLVGAENDPVARLTISEQISSDLEITYSQDLASNSQQIIQIEYFLNGDTSFVASRDEAGRLGLDIRLRKRFD